MKILVIDDSNSLRFMMVKLLKDIGYKNLTVLGSAEEALPMIDKEEYDLILLDWNLPVISGLDFLKRIRANPKTEKIAVIMVTTVHEKANILQALKIGVQGYILKPVERSKLEEKLKQIESELKAARTIS
ncbi:MAG TPA: response regulator [Chitinispirillaceae bacterium]|nr:response regulator [Chitinispirillaceae bacterium]